MRLDYSVINITGSIRESRNIRKAIQLFDGDVTVVAFDYASKVGTVTATVKINTPDPVATCEIIGRHVSYDTVLSPRVILTDDETAEVLKVYAT